MTTNWDPNKGEVLYEEEDDWVTPRAATEAELRPNISWLGPLYLWRGQSPQNARRIHLGPSRTYEIHAPWRHGRGLLLSIGNLAVAAGIGRSGAAPAILSEPPRAEDLQKVVRNSRNLK
jgi:hypothetical protein